MRGGWKRALIVSLVLVAAASAACAFTFIGNLDLAPACSAIQSPKGQASCDAGTCREGQCAYKPIAGITAAGGYCECQTTTTTTLAACRNSVTHVGCEGQCSKGLTCSMDASGKCQCGRATTTTTTIPACHYDAKAGCVGACRTGTCTYVPSLAAAGQGYCTCKTATTTTSTTTTTFRMFVPMNLSFLTTTTTMKTIITAIIPEVVLADSDNDGVADISDNCPDKVNGATFGTCSRGTNKGAGCLMDLTCGISTPLGGGESGHCSKDQEDSDDDGAGDACDTCPYDPLDRCELCSQANPALPARWDWRNVDGKNYMTSVKNQNPCGSCWAFSIVGAMEANYNIEHNNQTGLDLSEEYLVSDCFTGGDCGGCWPHNALPFVKTSGISDEACYPYTASDEACNRCAGYGSKLWTVNSWALYEDKSVDYVKKLIYCHGPVGVCNSDHCVVFAGWNNTANSWIVKNSWGTGWGTNGYALKAYSGDAFWSIMKNYAFTVDGTRKK